ncbi:MAG: AAA family ATPase [Clostridia bacterium]|jgi:chromosome partitioning protein|nr:ParA family protein [Clostridia bacterium]NLV32934.1 ParA family protein [Clostridiaceae bacterium]MDD4501485.1 AAA family ATPase [Clostridia bacterium]HPB16151.1 AAA family ATPase [Clostridia bacterium]HQM95376.1 AAA family ATPase [Clostridia bacterium]
MGKVMAIANQKGGVGKTTTSINLSASLAHIGKKTLLIDNDPQGNATSGLGVDKWTVEKSVYDTLINDIDIKDTILPTMMDNLFICPSNIQLAGAEIELVSQMMRENRLKNAIETIKKDYDYIVIDCPPSLGLLTLNSLTAADTILVPIQCEYYALEGLKQLMKTVSLVQKHLNPSLKVEGVVMTMYDSRTNLSFQVVESVREHFSDRVYRTIIPRNVRLSEAPSHGVPIILYDKDSRGAISYLELAEEVIQCGGRNG